MFLFFIISFCDVKADKNPQISPEIPNVLLTSEAKYEARAVYRWYVWSALRLAAGGSEA